MQYLKWPPRRKTKPMHCRLRIVSFQGASISRLQISATPFWRAGDRKRQDIQFRAPFCPPWQFSIFLLLFTAIIYVEHSSRGEVEPSILCAILICFVNPLPIEFSRFEKCYAVFSSKSIYLLTEKISSQASGCEVYFTQDICTI